ncbi:RRQRL motif-containing zinc-binding protein [Actinacidiphila glaucinigra]|uniref:RRQRL motif-containing zinc-binding protein n=1 Tax=Actinacidiphila glaucinigra TaxID=235986 RepID=UPI002DD7CD4A|nr:RRQRL motif-containing zinc-binding protein [Actinacidiphila glaucinigra]
MISPGGALPVYDWGSIDRDAFATRRQLRARGLRPGGHDPVAQLRCRKCLGLTRHCTRMAWLYRIDLALPKLPMTPAKRRALARAMRARRECPVCERVYIFCLPLKTLGSCLECYDGTPADPAHYTAPGETVLAA